MMQTTQVKLAYRQVIDAATEGAFAQNILRSSYDEFLLKSQVYNPGGKFKTFGEMKASDGRSNSLHYKTGFAVGGYMETLQKKMPAMPDNMGKAIPFDSYQFELIESDITDSSKHSVAIIYYSGTLYLISSIGEYLLLSAGNDPQSPEPISTFVVKMQPGLSISQYHQSPAA